MSQRSLAQRCGCSQRFISELERGKPTAELGKALGVLDELSLSIGIERSAVAHVGREAVDDLRSRVNSELERAERRRTSPTILRGEGMDAVEAAYRDVVDQWRERRIASRDQLANALSDYRVRFAYNSGNIENPELTHHDTRDVFEDGRVRGFTGSPGTYKVAITWLVRVTSRPSPPRCLVRFRRSSRRSKGHLRGTPSRWRPTSMRRSRTSTPSRAATDASAGRADELPPARAHVDAGALGPRPDSTGKRKGRRRQGQAPHDGRLRQAPFGQLLGGRWR